MKKESIKRALVFLGVFVIFVLILILLLGLIRAFNYSQLDDLHPLIICDEKYLEKSDVLMIIPLWENDSIANYPEWCQKIKDYNKTLGMHGIRHSYNEFLNKVSEEDFKLALGEFEKCFGQSPEIFEPPHWQISKENKMLVKRYLPLTSDMQGIFHKVYHCGKDEESSYRFLGIKITNQKVEIF